MGLRVLLWPDLSERDNDRDSNHIRGDPHRFAVFVAESSGELVGFIEVSLREYADGCSSSPVGYIEGWYVAPESRGIGIGRQLVAAAENWARATGCTEMASDSLIENVGGQRAHQHLGYSEVERQVCFRKDL